MNDYYNHTDEKLKLTQDHIQHIVYEVLKDVIEGEGVFTDIDNLKIDLQEFPDLAPELELVKLAEAVMENRSPVEDLVYAVREALG